MQSLIKKYLSEHIINSPVDEDYPMSWNIEEFKALKSFNKRVKYCQQHLQRINSGSSRIVYKIDDQKVLKLAKNRKGIAQNETEINWGNDGYYSYILANVLESDPDGLWVEMELAKKVTEPMFNNFFGFTTNDLYCYIANRLVDANKRRNRFSIDPAVEERISHSDFVNRLLNFISDTDADKGFGDFAHLSSYGLVKRHGKDELVIIDFGITSDIYSSYYS